MIFAPFDAPCVGEYRVATGAFRCVDISRSISMQKKFRGATFVEASGRKAIFAPYDASCVGVFVPSAIYGRAQPAPCRLCRMLTRDPPIESRLRSMRSSEIFIV